MQLQAPSPLCFVMLGYFPAMYHYITALLNAQVATRFGYDLSGVASCCVAPGGWGKRDAAWVLAVVCRQ